MFQCQASRTVSSALPSAIRCLSCSDNTQTPVWRRTSLWLAVTGPHQKKNTVRYVLSCTGCTWLLHPVGDGEYCPLLVCVHSRAKEALFHCVDMHHVLFCSCV